jgi:hypothetical protein
MAQQGKQMGVSARVGFPYHSVKLILLAKGNRHEVEVDFNKKNYKWKSALST